MATTKNQLIYDLWMVLSPLVSDDSIIEERMLSYWVDNQRSIWIRNEYNKSNRSVDDNVIQSLGALEFDVVDRIEGSPYTGGSAKIIKSKVQIPVAIELHNQTLLTRIGSLDITCRPFKLIDYLNAPYMNNGKFNSSEIFCFLKGGYLYAISGCNNPAWKTLKYLNIQGVFEVPSEVSRFRELDGSACYTDDSNYPVNRWMIDYMKSEIIKSDLRPFLQPQIDESNNANPIPEQINTDKK